MPRPRLALVAAAALALGMLLVAFVAAPRSCEGGLEFYAGTGVAVLCALLALPFLARMGDSAPARVAWSAGFLTFGGAVWLGGLFLANVRIMCRLF